jgi:hypothetical protein
VIHESGIQRVSVAQLAELIRVSERDGWKVFCLPSNIIDGPTFFDGVRNTLPLDPPVRSSNNWDALSDSLWSGLDNLDDERIVVVWPDAFRMEALDPEAFRISQIVLRDLVNSLSNPEMTLGKAKRIVILEGEA